VNVAIRASNVVRVRTSVVIPTDILALRTSECGAGGQRPVQQPCPAAASVVAVLAVCPAPARCGNAVNVYSSVHATSAVEAAVQAGSVARSCAPRLPIAAFDSAHRSVQSWNCSMLGHAWVVLQQLSMLRD
jgi:hypothetical protein